MFLNFGILSMLNQRMSYRFIKIIFFIAFILFDSSLGAGGSEITGKPEGDKSTEIKLIKHNLELPPGFSFSEEEVLTVISAEYGNKYYIPKSIERPSDIMSKGQLPKNRMSSFLWLHNSLLDPLVIEEIVDLYIQESAFEGVNHDIAFTQMLLETGYLRFSGDVNQNQNNFCGLGATGSGEPGLYFSNKEEGVRAHIQHLKAYASNEPIKNDIVSSRIQFVSRGSAMNIHDLTGKWAVDPLYGKKIDQLLKKIYEGVQRKPKRTSILFD